MSVRPPLLKLGGHTEFPLYRWTFNQIYKGRTITDVLGNTVRFGVETAGYRQLNGAFDCDHVCYGGTDVSRSDWSNPSQGRLLGNPLKWDQKRAERILWINAALTDPDIRIHRDVQFEERRRYLLVTDPVPEKNIEREYFCVIAEVLRKNEMAFITAYDITPARWSEYRQVPPRFWPVQIAKANKKKKSKG